MNTIKRIIASAGLVGLLLGSGNVDAHDSVLDKQNRTVIYECNTDFRSVIEYKGRSRIPFRVTTTDYGSKNKGKVAAIFFDEKKDTLDVIEYNSLEPVKSPSYRCEMDNGLYCSRIDSGAQKKDAVPPRVPLATVKGNNERLFESFCRPILHSHLYHPSALGKKIREGTTVCGYKGHQFQNDPQ